MQHANEGLRRYPSPKTDWHWRFKVLKGEILVWQHLNEQSLTLSEQDLPPSFADTDIAVWRRLSQAVASAYTHQLSNAHRYLDQAEAIAKAHHPELLGQVALRKGTLLFWDGSLLEAQAAYYEALQLARAEHNSFLEAAALGSLGLVATKLEHYDESLDWNRAALGLSQSIGAQSSVAHILGNMAWCFRELGDYDNALVNYRQAEEAAKKNGQIGDVLYWRSGTATVYYLQGNYSSAEAALQEYVAQARQQDDKSITAFYLNDLALLALETGKVDSAEVLAREATQVEPSSGDTSDILDTVLIQGRIGEAKLRYTEAQQSFESVINNPAASMSQKWEAEARLGSLYAKQNNGPKAEAGYKRAINTIQAARQSIEQDELRLTLLSGPIHFYDDYIDFLMRLGRIEDALRTADLTRSQALSEGLASEHKGVASPELKIPPSRLAQRLHAVLLVYWLGEDRSYLWVVTPAGTSYAALPKKSEVDAVTKRYRQAILDGHDVLVTDRDAGQQLYTMLVEPARKFISNNQRVILLPSESLYGLNFETLVVPGSEPHFWIEDVTLTTANSLALLSSASSTATNRAKSLLLVGNPESPDTSFPQLPQAADEIKRVSLHFPSPQCRVLEGAKATASAYLQSNPGDYAYLHFATHGTASHLRPLDSAIILSKEGSSYKLYARDILTHPLHAQLVTISACHGAGTRTLAGEGLVGLSWAFLRAGAHNVIAALWEVSDSSSTTQLMDSLYQGLERGEDPATALRQAKLGILKSNSTTVFHKPFYWAPFQLHAGS